MSVEGKRTFISQYIEDEEVICLRDDGLLRERWVNTLLNIKSRTPGSAAVDERRV